MPRFIALCYNQVTLRSTWTFRHSMPRHASSYTQRHCAPRHGGFMQYLNIRLETNNEYLTALRPHATLGHCTTACRSAVCNTNDIGCLKAPRHDNHATRSTQATSMPRQRRRCKDLRDFATLILLVTPPITCNLTCHTYPYIFIVRNGPSRHHLLITAFHISKHNSESYDVHWIDLTCAALRAPLKLVSVLEA